jgi:hypothetical protein
MKKDSSDKVSCIVYKGNDIQVENVAKILRIADETWLSVTLKIFEPSEILSIVNHLVSIDNLTHFIYSFYQSEKESFINEFWKRKRFAITNEPQSYSYSCSF